LTRFGSYEGFDKRTAAFASGSDRSGCALLARALQAQAVTLEMPGRILGILAQSARFNIQNKAIANGARAWGFANRGTPQACNSKAVVECEAKKCAVSVMDTSAHPAEFTNCGGASHWETVSKPAFQDGLVFVGKTHLRMNVSSSIVRRYVAETAYSRRVI